MSLNETPKSNRVHIGLFGKRNSGKSSLVNFIANEELSIVSDFLGTTTDPVYKPIEINGIGACVLIDTAGFDDDSQLGELRIIKTKQVIRKTDIGIIIITDDDFSLEKKYYMELKKNHVPVIFVINKIDCIDHNKINHELMKQFKEPIIKISVKNKENVKSLINEIKKQVPQNEFESITKHLLKENSLVLLVMPQDIQAPKGRLILPQVQTIRDLLDNKAIIISVTLDNLKNSLSLLNKEPDLIITDSQVFKEVNELKPKNSVLTSFSVLFARYKGDIDTYVQGAEFIDKLAFGDKVLIAESCSHLPLDGDIARVKIPNLLQKKVGGELSIKVVSGSDFPDDLENYKLVIMCGGCMFNRQHILSRIQKCVAKNTPVTNYGIAIAKLTGVTILY